jgi:ADP-heptose:LPS heptosyltransferase
MAARGTGEGIASIRLPAVLAFTNFGIGDRLLTLPAMQALTHMLPGQLTVVCDRFAAANMYSALNVRRFVEVEELCDDKIYYNIESLAEKLDGVDFLTVFNTWHSESTRKLLTLLNPLWSVGHFDYCKTVVPVDDRTNVVDTNFSLVQACFPGLDVATFARPQFSSYYHDLAKQIRSTLPQGSRVLAVHLDTNPAKMLPKSTINIVLDSFLQRHEEYFVFLLGWKDRGLEKIKNRNRVMTFIRLPFLLQCCLIEECDCFVGVDSCFMHAADLFAIPGICIYGPVHPEKWGFRFSPHVHLGNHAASGVKSRDRLLEAVESFVAEHTSQFRFVQA